MYHITHSTLYTKKFENLSKKASFWGCIHFFKWVQKRLKNNIGNHKRN